MAYVFTFYTAIMRFLFGLSATDPSKTVERPGRYSMEIMQSPHPRIEIVWRTLGDRTVVMQSFVYQTCTTSHF